MALYKFPQFRYFFFVYKEFPEACEKDKTEFSYNIFKDVSLVKKFIEKF
jgi:hypothetical protein